MVLLSFPFVLLFTKYNSDHGPDGNYFIIPVSCIFIYLAIKLEKVPSVNNIFLKAAITVTLVSNFLIAFVTTDWGPGTSKFSPKLNASIYHYNLLRDRIIKNAHAEEVYYFFNKVERSSRVIGFEKKNSGMPLGLFLPVSYETIETIHFSNHDLIKDSVSFEAFLKNNSITHVLVEDDAPNFDQSSYFRNTIYTLISDGRAHIASNSERFVIYKID